MLQSTIAKNPRKKRISNIKINKIIRMNMLKKQGSRALRMKMLKKTMGLHYQSPCWTMLYRKGIRRDFMTGGNSPLMCAIEIHQCFSSHSL